MKQTQLILLEGIPGSGKSTAAAWLRRTLQSLNVPHRWWYEGMKGHPLYTFDDPASLKRTLDDIFSGDDSRRQRVVDETLQRWAALTDTLRRNGEVAIFDGVLFGHLTWTLYPVGVPDETILAYVAEAERLAQSLNPCLIYLRQDDVETGMRRIVERRGPAWGDGFVRRHEGFPLSRQREWTGFAGLVAYWQSYQALADRLFERSALDKCRVAVDPQQWDSISSEIASFLELPVTSPTTGEYPVTMSDLERYVGSYTYPRGEKVSRCRVSLDAGSLFIDDLPDVWQHTRLIPLGAATFAAESLPYEFTFVADAAGTVNQMTVSGPASVWGSLPATLWKDSL